MNALSRFGVKSIVNQDIIALGRWLTLFKIFRSSMYDLVKGETIDSSK